MWLCYESDFAKFQEKVGEIKLDATQTKVVVTGKITIGNTEQEVNYDSSVGIKDIVSPIVALVLEVNDVFAYAITEDTNSSYYAGTSFKMTNDVLKIEWNKYGDCTKAKGKLGDGKGTNYSVDLSAKYTYETK